MIQPGLIIARELGHLTEDELTRVTIYLARRVLERLRVTSCNYSNGGTLDTKRALSEDRAGGVARSIVRSVRKRGGHP